MDGGSTPPFSTNFKEGASQMLAQVQYLKSVAASGTDSLTYSVPADVRTIAFKLAGNFGAASSSGLTAVIQYSQDGTNFSNSSLGSVTITSTATGEVEKEFVYRLQDSPYIPDPQPVTKVQLNITNNDGSHACVLAILTEIETERGQ